MSTINNDHIKDVLFELTELSDKERAKRLQNLQITDPELAAKVLALLPGALHTDPGLHAPNEWTKAMINSGLPERLGPWRVLHEIGRGGMGVVMLGERADGAFAMQVAIKILPPAFAGNDGAARLTAEATTLSRLTHPNITRLLDAGFEQGCAYLVMEYIDGVQLFTHVENEKLSNNQKITLMLELCSALRFAHNQLLIHRDIKPANVMVDKNGRLRLLDFGIAKVLGSEELTQTMSLACTPAYASPEQLLGQPISVASDVFSLGVLLYELLTTQRPFGVRTESLLPSLASQDFSATTVATMRSVLEDEPALTPLTEAEIPKDLRAIVMKALEKSLTRRYATVEALAVDLQAYLEGKPVSAQNPSVAYQLKKFVSRHKFAVTSSVLAMSTILGFATWAIINAQQANTQREVAQKRLEAVRSIANKVVFDYNDALRPIAGTLEVRKILVADALKYLDALSQDANGDRTLQADIASGLEAVGDVQGRGATEGNLGDLEGANNSYQKAIVLRRQLCTSTNASITPTQKMDDCVAYANTLVHLGDNIFTTGDVPEAIRQFDTALQVTDVMVTNNKSQTKETEYRKPESREKLFNTRFDITQRLAGLSGRQTGEAYARGLDLAKAQLQAAQELWAINKSSTAKENLRAANDLLAVRLLNNGQVDAALKHMQLSIALAREIVEAQPDRDASVSLSVSLTRLAEIQTHRLQIIDAKKALKEAFTIAKNLFEAEPQDRHLRARYAMVARRWAQVHNQMGDAQALQENQKTLPAVLFVTSIFKPADGVFYFQHQQIKLELAQTLLTLGHAKEALLTLSELPDALPKHPRAATDMAPAFILRAKILLTLGKVEEAKHSFTQAYEHLHEAVNATPADVQQAAYLLQTQAWARQYAHITEQYPTLSKEMTQKRVELMASRQLSPWWQQSLSF